MDYSEFEMDNRCVVFYDSGTGGLRLFEKTRKAFPSENYVYFADEKYMPFGDKTKEELLKIFDEAEKKDFIFLPQTSRRRLQHDVLRACRRGEEFSF